MGGGGLGWEVGLYYVDGWMDGWDDRQGNARDRGCHCPAPAPMAPSGPPARPDAAQLLPDLWAPARRDGPCVPPPARRGSRGGGDAEVTLRPQLGPTGAGRCCRRNNRKRWREKHG